MLSDIRCHRIGLGYEELADGKFAYIMRTNKLSNMIPSNIISNGVNYNDSRCISIFDGDNNCIICIYHEQFKLQNGKIFVSLSKLV